MAKIFLIEDNVQLRDNTRRSLELGGHEVEAFDRGVSALEALARGWPDLILCDVMMPGMDGHTVLTEVRKMPGGAGVPFVFLTALAERGDMRKGMDSGADDYLTKPFTIAELFAAVDSRLRAKQSLRVEVEERQREVDVRKLRVLPHEFRTPLNGILGGISLLQDEFGHLGDSFSELAGMVQESAVRMERTLLNYVFYVELSSGRFQPAEPGETKIGELVRKIAWGEAAACGRTGDLQIGEMEERWRVDRDILEIVVREVVSNALKFSSSGTLVAVSREGAGRLVVEDSGFGMSCEEIARVGPFRQFGREQREHQGLGLGLAICRELEKFGGPTLRLEPRPGGGLRVTLSAQN